MSIQIFTFYSEDEIIESITSLIGNLVKKEDPKFAEQTMTLLKAKQYIKVLDALLKYDEKVFALPQESDIENFYANLFTFINFIAESESAKAITSICNSISKFKGHIETHFTLLNLLYHIVPVSYPESGIVLDNMLKYVIESNHYHICDEIISLLLTSNYSLLSCDVELKRQILLSAEKIATHSQKHSDAITLMTYYLETFQSAKNTELDSIKENTIRFITTIFHYPKYQKLPSYMKLDAIKYLKQDSSNSVLYQLFELFIKSNYSELSQFYESHKSDLEKYKLPYSSIIEHCRLLTLCSLASESDILSYDQIAKALDIPIDEVENWVVHCINQKLIEGKMNQVKSEVVILRSCTRTFDSQKWNKLEEKLNDFSNKIDGLLQILEDTPSYE